MKKNYDKKRIIVKLIICTILIIMLANKLIDIAGLKTKAHNIISSDLIVEFIDVGYGNATFVKNDKFTMLIDTGDKIHYNNVVKTLKKYNVKKLDYLFLTNNEDSHIGASSKIIKKYNPDNILASAMINSLDANKKIKYPSAGYMFNYDKLKIMVIAPVENKITKNNSEILSLMVRLDYGKTGFLICSDSTIDKYYKILKKDKTEAFNNIDVLGVENHGSIGAHDNEKTAMELLNPKYAVISSDTHNIKKELTDAFNSKNIKALFTKDSGNITFYSNGNKVKVNN